MARTIKTTKQDVYIRLVENAKASRDSDVSEPDKDRDYLFKYQYELFSFAAALGFLHEKPTDEPDTYSQDIRRVEDMGSNDPHRLSIEFVAALVAAEEGLEENEAWDMTLRYADAGVERIDSEIDLQEDFDMIRFVQESDSERWYTRLKDSIGSPDEVQSPY